ncbi:histidine phosphatase family protein [Oscillospiraceae bacterium PP1C4]
MLTYKIHLIRHGLTQGNLEGRYIGVTDLPLCEEGRLQLQKMSEQCEYPVVDRVYSSPMLRATQTVEILYPDRYIEVVDNLREFNFGDFEGRTMQDLEKDPQFQQWISSAATAGTPNGETGLSLQTRAQEAIAYIFAQMMEKRMLSVAVVTHGGLIMNLLACMGLPEREMVRWGVDNGRGYTVLLTTQMWMRDHKFEVYAQIPYEESEQGSNGEADYE